MSTIDIIITVVLAFISISSGIIGTFASYAIDGLSNRLKEMDQKIQDNRDDLEQWKMEYTELATGAARSDALLQERLSDIKEIKEELMEIRKGFKEDLRVAINELKELITSTQLRF